MLTSTDQFIETVDLVIGDTPEHPSQLRLRVNCVHLGGFDQGVGNRCNLSGESWLFLAALIDRHTRKVVGWSMRETLLASIALEALDIAIRRKRLAPVLIQHSDRGIRYAADAYSQALAAAKITPSMSRKGNCRDNASMESFFHALKVERVHHRV